ncbi:MAG: primosomal protein N' [Bacillota bacterium]|nr:MAG: primosomal protein N' [Bacillota bacterium]
MYVDVIVDILSGETDRIFEYFYDGDDIRAGERVSVPFGRMQKDGIVMRVKPAADYSADKIKSVIGRLDNVPALTEECLALAEKISAEFFVSKAAALRLFLPAELRRGTVREQIVKYAEYAAEDFEAAFSSLRKSAAKQRAALAYLHEKKRGRVTELNALFGAGAVSALAEKGFFALSEEKSERRPYTALAEEEKKVKLTAEQQSAVDKIEGEAKEITLLHGVTGSGKTEVYLTLIKSVLERGKTAIMLVPEISLTPQMLKNLRGRFGDECAILHSGLSAGERFDEWWRLRSGEAKIAVGARSAVFAPLENVGLIVIDEEHDGSYQSESAPRYNTLDVARFRADYNGAKIVIGSATPSVESYRLASSGEYGLVEMNNRINRRALPEVEIVDMRREVRRGNNTAFSGALKAELKEVLEKGNQAIVFLNQRGYSKSVICTSCGYVPKCEACDVSLTYHMEEGALKCHYCNAKYKMIKKCPECGSELLRYGGVGTQRVVGELQKLFPSARIVRMDRDATQNKEGHLKILSDFAAKKADILVGTQMIAKGHDFPSVTLVGILDADMSLHFSDYRSGERTFQLLTQVAGRSGRAGETGRVVLQTYQPDNNVLRLAVKYDYKGFYENEIALRRATGFPPFTEIIRVLVSGEDDGKTKDALRAVYEALNAEYLKNTAGFKFFGYMKAPIKRLNNKFRYQVLMRTTLKNFKYRVQEICAGVKSRGVYVNVEINPNNLT